MPSGSCRPTSTLAPKWPDTIPPCAAPSSSSRSRHAATSSLVGTPNPARAAARCGASRNAKSIVPPRIAHRDPHHPALLDKLDHHLEPEHPLVPLAADREVGDGSLTWRNPYSVVMTTLVARVGL